MRLLGIRRAKLKDPELRDTFERYGQSTMQVVLGTTNYIWHKNQNLVADKFRDDLLAWLTEEHDKTDLRESWLLLMEIAITVLVGAEVCFEVYDHCWKG